MRRAFTLVELLVVIAIIAILIAILLPVLSRVRSSARLTACIVNTRSFGDAANSYLLDNDGYMPRGNEGQDYNSYYGQCYSGNTFMHLGDYLGLKSVDKNGFPCLGAAGPNATTAYYKTGNIFRCPSRKYSANKLLDYSVNTLHFERLYQLKAAGDTSWWTKSNGEAGYFPGITKYTNELLWPTHYITDLSKTMLFAESIAYEDRPSGSLNQFFSPNHMPWKNGTKNTDVSSNGMRMMTSWNPTHQGEMAYTAFDGSSYSINLTEGSEWGSRNARMNGGW